MTIADVWVWRTLSCAFSHIGVREAGKNRGPEVDMFLRKAGLDPERGSYPWCQAFVYYCLRVTADRNRIYCAAPRTASVMKHWAKVPAACKTTDIRAAKPGCVFVMDHGQGRGHTGFIAGIDVREGTIQTVEGNTNVEGSREGDGVYLRSRELHEIAGVIDYTKLKGLTLLA